MDPLSAQQLQTLRQLLLDEERALRRTLVLTSELAQTVDLAQPIGRLSRMDAMQQQQMAEEQRRRQKSRLKQLVAAIGRFEDEGYGECRTCEEPIAYKRLLARPETPFCVPCMSQMERRGLR